MLFQSSVMRKQVKNLLLYEVTYITSNVSEIQVIDSCLTRMKSHIHEFTDGGSWLSVSNNDIKY